MGLKMSRRAALLAGMWLGTLSGLVLAQGARPFLSMADGSMSARIDGASCGETVRMVFVARDPESFKAGQDTAARLMNNVTTLLRQQCPSLVRVSAKGVSKERILYTGIAEAATRWEVVELGNGTGSGLLSGGAGSATTGTGPSAMQLFARDAAFAPAARVLEWLKASPNLCVRFDAKTNTCAGLNQFASEGEGAVRMMASYRLDQTGSTAELTYPARVANGFFCSNPRDAKITIKDGTLSAAGRADMQSMLLERIQGAGSEVCTGYLGASPQSLQTESFGEGGASQAQRTQATLMAQRLPLRLDR